MPIWPTAKSVYFLLKITSFYRLTEIAPQGVADLGHGVLTYALLAAIGEVDKGPLARQSLALSGEEGILNVRRWFSFAQDKVPALTQIYFQKEQFVRFIGAGNDFPILPLEE